MLRPLLIAALLLTPATALAQPHGTERGEEHLRAGVEAYGRRQFRAAAIEFRAAYELTGEAMLLFNLGSALAADGQRDAAREAFEQYLRALPQAPNRVAVEARLRELAPPPTFPPPPAVVVVPAATPPVVAAVPRTPPVVEVRRSTLPLVGAVVGGAGLVAAGVGLGLYLDVDARLQSCAANHCSAAEQSRGEDAAAVALLWGGGAVALAGLVTFLVAPRTTRAAPRAIILPQPGGLLVAGTF